MALEKIMICLYCLGQSDLSCIGQDNLHTRCVLGQNFHKLVYFRKANSLAQRFVQAEAFSSEVESGSR
jgi:hypothetical protein